MTSATDSPHQTRARRWINKHSAAVILVSVAFTILAWIEIVGQLKSKPAAPAKIDAYFYDLETDRLFIAPYNQLPPIAAPGTSADAPLTAVHAAIYACNNCDDPRDRFIAWLDAYTPNARARRPASAGLASDATTAEEFEAGHLLAKPGTPDSSWKITGFVEMMSPRGQAIIAEAQQICGPDKSPFVCSPESSSY